MGRWGVSELQAGGAEVVGVMSHLASADSDALTRGGRSIASGPPRRSSGA